MKRALIVDDIKENLYLLEALLKAFGFITVTANNGAEALGLALKDPPDIIISDILMPVMDGYTLCHEWKKEDTLKNIPFVFYTATYTHPKDEEFAINLGADKFIIKPQEPEDFMRMIEQVLSEFRNGKIQTSPTLESTEISMLKEYNETLIRKMEDRMLKSEEAEKKIRLYASQLETEIEHRKQIEQTLKESEEKYRSIFENSGIGILLTSPEGRIFSANDFACKLFGRTEEEIIQLGRDGLVDHTDPNLQLLLDERKRIGHAKGELTFIRKDGSKFLAEVSSVIFQDKDRNERTSMVIRDLTEQKKAEEALKESELRFRILAESAPVGIFTTDALGSTNYVNPRWCEISKLSFEEALGDGWLKAVHPEDLDNLSENWNQNTKSQTGSKAEYRFVHPDGSSAWVIGQAIPQKDEKGKITRYIGTITDITERKKMEADLIFAKEKAEESDRLKSAFLANMSHEIRTPMNGILGFAELLKEPDLTGDQQQDYIEIIEKSGARMLNIINDIIDISKIESGQMQVFLNETDVNEQLEFICKLFNREVEQKGLRLSLMKSLSPLEARITTDREKLYAVLANLVKNAIKYTQQGSIELGCGIDGTTQAPALQFFVKDTGIGIPKYRQEAIFERFIQADIFDKMALQGAGLGLAISKAYVEMLGGKIWVESEEGNGSAFYFTIPFLNKNEEKTLETITFSGSENVKNIMPLKIIIAEDDETSSQLLSLDVQKFGKEVITVNTGKKAVETCRMNPDTDLILMDIKMPELDGLDATRQIRQFNSDVIIIAQTAYALSGDKEKAVAAGCNDFITKPVKKESLLNMVGMHLKQKK
jgi:PAS domain S-box-containing protein